MRLKTFFVRFYKSFNFDYLRKYHNSTIHQPWDFVGDLCYPYVRIPIDAKVTAVVGANESGKSHLLSAIEKGLTGDKIAVEDMCRYSQFYTVEIGKRKFPDFGFEFDGLEETEKTTVASFFEGNPNDFESFFFFRSQNNIELYLPSRSDEQPRSVTIKGKDADKLQKLLPQTFQIKSNIALPNSVPIMSLVEKEDKNSYESNREVRIEALETLQKLVKSKSKLFDSMETVTKNAAAITELMNPLVEAVQAGKLDSKDEVIRKEEIKLARNLVCKIAKVDPDALKELYNAIKDGKDGHAAGLIQNINQQLEMSLNFPHWWVQDKQFQLVVTAREVDLVFTIRDRTGTEYSFSERSNGLKYFLSYYVQYLAHEPSSDNNEILLMDEPDAYLSSQAQQDLLKIFDSFASPESLDKSPIQVVYVTHSPFLIDKNHAERIRVLEKGVSEEGTRIVKDAGKNHYEPLRSAFGAFVGETVFIGNTNLFVEGLADQILLAGSAIHLRKNSKLLDETLDLNQLTIVPAGSASHIPYLVYLARGRDVEKPAVVVLLDSDKSGNDARKSLKRGGVNNKQLLREELILQLGEVKNGNALSLPTGKGSF
jgi:predicted ATP-dependent endonuclease of OLD family